ncbi:MAG TPA: hypothetical protein VFE36_10070 [Candidatus Baltobacteraceae bacterium]|jgi:GAF domain-containing protein|nr:hypothetical protein [Candidatus Baltobacteraceae bacterium]
MSEPGSYAAARSFGNGAATGVSENDESSLALKTWHRPIDPHQYAMALGGALAVPMLARDRLAGVLLLGERAGGEAFAPDEIEALSQFAQGVDSALQALSSENADSVAMLRETIRESIAEAIASLNEKIDVISGRLPDETRLRNIN